MDGIMSRNIIRKLYDWVLSWANSRYSIAALFILAFTESSCFPVPPDVLLIALCVSKPARAMLYSLITTLGSISGGICGYFIGMKLWEYTSNFFFTYIPGFTPEGFNYVKDLYGNNAFWAVFISGFTPIPYKVFTITAGVCRISFIVFLIASVLGRGGRFFLVGGLIKIFGEPVKKIINKYFNLLTVLFAVLLIAGFLVLKFVIKN